MKILLKTWVISAAIATMSLNADANDFMSSQNILENQTNIELSSALNFQNGKEIIGANVDSKVITKAILDYFDEEVKLYKLSSKTRTKIVTILNYYFLVHPVLVIWDEWRMRFVIDDKKEFISVVKQVVNMIIDDMPFLVRKVWVPLVFGWNDKLQEKLNNLWNTVMNMKEKQYKNVVFDYVWWIVKRVAKSVDWKMTVKEYYDDVSSYFPNKNSFNISKEVNRPWNWNVDIKNLEYPFKR